MPQTQKQPLFWQDFEQSYTGITSLEDLATKDDRVCVINIMGGESKTVTPISHVYSGGNIVCGTMPGRRGSAMKTAAGDIPVYNNIAEAVKAGHVFNTVVVYVPPAGVKDAVIEAVDENPGLKKVIILTEKVSLRDARIIRRYCQLRQIDVFGSAMHIIMCALAALWAAAPRKNPSSPALLPCFPTPETLRQRLQHIC